jgi:flagellar biosynthetic protein FliR
MDQLTPILIATFLATFARCGAFLYAMPFLGEQVSTTKLRVAIAIAIAATITPARPAITLEMLTVAIPWEMMLGLLAGNMMRLVVAGVESGGQYIGMVLGIGFATFYDPSAGGQALVTQRILHTILGLAFFLGGGLETALRLLCMASVSAETLELSMLQLFEMSGSMFVEATRLVAPVLGVTMIANVAVALASRASPGINVFVMVMPLMFFLGIVAMIATSPWYARELMHLGRQMAEVVAKVIRP